MKRSLSLTRGAMLFALCIVLNFIEGLAVIAPSFPGVKAGLSNIPVMFALFSLGLPDAISLAVAKGIFSLITRGVSAGILSLSGGVFSILIMCLIKKLFKNRVSLTVLSISGAVTHNIAQISAVSLLWKSMSVFSLSPVLIVSGVVFGTVNALLLKFTLPYLKKIGGKK